MTTNLIDNLRPFNKSTIVRSLRRSKAKAQWNVLSAGLRFLADRSPALTTTLAERLFRTPPRSPLKQSDEDALVLADPVSVQFGGKPIPTWSFGEGPTVLLVHGWGGRGVQLRAFVEPLVASGHRVILFDGPGHGASPGLSSLPELAAATRAIIDAERPVAMITHSMGGPAALLALRSASHRPERLVLLAPPTDLSNATAYFARVFGLPDRVRTDLELALERRFLIKMRDLRVVPLDSARGQGLPLLVIHDQHDRDVPVSEGARLANAWPGARFIETRHLGHYKILRDPSVIRSVVSFLAADSELRAGGGAGAKRPAPGASEEFAQDLAGVA